MNILIICEAPVESLELVQFLREHGHGAISCARVDQAIDCVETSLASVLIVGPSIPGSSALELCRQLRARQGSTYVYIILLVAPESGFEVMEGLQAGADDVIPGGRDSLELVARLQVATRIVALQDQLREKAVMLEQLSDQLSTMNERLALLATTDAMTGLHNRRHFEESLVAMSRHSERHGRSFSLALIDIDHFKTYNDTFGHQAGDDALRLVAELLRDGVRAYDHVARFGGEEFTIILPDSNADDAWSALERLRLIVSDHAWPLRPVTISSGLSNLSGNGGPQRMIQEADLALYAAKRRGRNRVVHHRDLADVEQAEYQALALAVSV